LKSKFPLHGWIGLTLALVFWYVNWTWDGSRTFWAFFPMWLGYCLTIDGLVHLRTGTSLLTRSPRRYAGLFLLSAPVWWLFEALNLITHNWSYLGAQNFSPLAYAFWTTLSFTTVIPAVFGSAELVASFESIGRLGRGPRLRGDRLTTWSFFIAGWLMLGLMIAWPQVFFPFIWISPYFIFEPINIWLGYRSLADWTAQRDWRPVISLWLGVLLTGFFWEMWNFYSYPKWIYQVGWGGWFHVFEMPLLGYGGYLPFSLELYAIYHLVSGLLGQQSEYVRVVPRLVADEPSSMLPDDLMEAG
jgi:hypothetical protein